MIYKDTGDIVKSLGEHVLKFEGKTVLLTGATGFLGRWFCSFFSHINKKVLKQPCKVIAVDNNISGDPTKIQNLGIKLIESDITSSLTSLAINTGNIDYIINAAGIASPEVYQKYPFETLGVSYTGTHNILKLAQEKNVESVLCFSSSEVYGTPDVDNIPTKEEYMGAVPTMSNRSSYDIGKKVIETLCHIYCQEKNSPVKIVRPFNVYGPGMHARDHRVLGNFIFQVINNNPLRVYGDGEQTRTFCYITDAMNGFLRALLLGESGQVYNIGNPYPEISMNELASITHDALGKKEKIERVPYPETYPADEPRRRCPDISKAETQLDYNPKIKLKEGIKKMYEWGVEENDTII